MCVSSLVFTWTFARPDLLNPRYIEEITSDSSNCCDILPCGKVKYKRMVTRGEGGKGMSHPTLMKKLLIYK